MNKYMFNRCFNSNPCTATYSPYLQNFTIASMCSILPIFPLIWIISRTIIFPHNIYPYLCIMSVLIEWIFFKYNVKVNHSWVLIFCFSYLFFFMKFWFHFFSILVLIVAVIVVIRRQCKYMIQSHKLTLIFSSDLRSVILCYHDVLWHL